MKRCFLTLFVLFVADPVFAQEDSPATLVQRLMSIWESGNVSALSKIMSEEVIYEDKPNRRILKGIPGAASYVSHVHTWASEVTIDIKSVRSSESAAYAEWVMTGIQSSPIPGRVPIATNRPVEIHGMTAIEVVDGKIVRAVDYLDALGFVIQLGATVDLPGGVTLGETK